MKGFMFANFLEFVEKTHSLQLIDDMILSCNLPSGGVYSAFNKYEFDELVTMLTYVSKKTDTTVEVLLEQFGVFVFPYFIRKHSYIIEKYSNPLDLLAGIQDHIHTEVKKLYKDADLPTLRATNRTENRLTLIYNSSKGLTFFAVGLIKGTLHHFKVKGSVLVDDSFDKKKGVKLDVQLLS